MAQPEAGKLHGRLGRLRRPHYLDMIMVYVIRSLHKRYRYVGITDNLERRIRQHNVGKSISTRNFAPFYLLFTESYCDRSRARSRGKFLKSGAGRKFLDELESRLCAGGETADALP